MGEAVCRDNIVVPVSRQVAGGSIVQTAARDFCWVLTHFRLGEAVGGFV